MNLIIDGMLIAGIICAGWGGYYLGNEQAKMEQFQVISKLQEEKKLLERENEQYRLEAEKRKQEQKVLEQLDLQTDSSLQKFVTAGTSFLDKKYIPQDLETVKSAIVVDQKNGKTQLRKEANEALQKMGEKFQKDMGFPLQVVSGYRSYEYQLRIEQWGCPAQLCARAGFSEHQSGLALDLFSASNQDQWSKSEKLSKIFDWLKNNAHFFGFHNSYQKGKEVDGYDIEPWHWRYVWTDFASYLQKKNITFSQYFRNYSRINNINKNIRDKQEEEQKNSQKEDKIWDETEFQNLELQEEKNIQKIENQDNIKISDEKYNLL